MEFVQIGRLNKTYGLNGEIRSQIEDRFWNDVLQAEVLFVEIKGQKIPFFIDEIKEGSDILLKFEEVGDRESAALLSGKSLFIRTSDLQIANSEQLTFDEQLPGLISYTIWTEDGQEVGPIVDLIEMPMQVLAVVEKKGQEQMIPLAEDLIIDIQAAEKKIVMSLPEGLLDL